MCRLLGVIASKPVDLEYLLVTGPRPFRDLGGLKDPSGRLKPPEWAPYQEKNFHPDGWGLGWYESSRPRFRKRPEPAAQSTDLPLVAAEARSNIMFAHVRKATLGEKTEQNCQPFINRNWLFTHNGTLERKPLYDKLNSEHRAGIDGTTDSEVFFHYILQSIEQRANNVVERLRSALTEAGKYEVKGMNLLLSDGESLFAFRQSCQDQEYYSLRYLPMDYWPAAKPAETPAPERPRTPTGAPAAPLKAVLVCSEKLTDGDWQDIPLGQMLAVSPQFGCRLISVFESKTDGCKG